MSKMTMIAKRTARLQPSDHSMPSERDIWRRVVGRTLTGCCLAGLVAGLMQLPSSALSQPPASPAQRPAAENAGQPERADASPPSPNIAAAQKLVDQLAAGEFEQAAGAFDETMARVLPADKLRETWQQLLKQAGAFKSRGAAKSQKIGPHEAVLVSCEFEKAKLVARVVFDARQRVAGLFFQPETSSAPYRPPTYAQPDKFEERPITLNEDPWQVPGTLTLPKGEGPFPAVVLVAGSGPNDRDETIGPNKPLKDLAWGLASRGIAVVRYDKRTRVHGARIVASKLPLTVREEVLDDAIQAVRLLRETPSVDSRRIFVVGHSLGGYLVPRIAKSDSENWIRGFVVLAGNTRPLQDLMWDQVNYLLRLDGALSDADQQQLDQLQQQIKIVTDPALSDKRSTTPAILGVGPDYWLDLRDYDPVAMAVAMRQPLLVLHADRDYQVTEKDLAGWQTVADSREGVTLERYTRLNHLFQPGEGRSVPSEYLAPNHFDLPVIEDIVKWIGSHKP